MAKDKFQKINKLLQMEKLKVINVGLQRFANTYKQTGVLVIDVNWRPPAGGDKELRDILSALND